MQKLKWLSVLLPLLCAGAFPSVTTGCIGGIVDAFGTPCRKVGQTCGLLAGNCCDGPNACNFTPPPGDSVTCQRP